MRADDVSRSSSSRWKTRAALLAILLVLVARIVPTWTTFSDTVDEPYHLGAGLSLLETGKLQRGFQHPPLARLVAAVPIYLSGVRDTVEDVIGPTNDLSAFNVGHYALLHDRLPYWTVLVRARAAMLIFPLVTLVYAYLLTRWLAGRWVGVCVAAWLSTDPTLLGHSTWITTDVPAAAGFLAVIYHGLRFIVRPSATHAIIAGVVAGLGVACKFTVALAAPALLIVLLVHSPLKVQAWRNLVIVIPGAFVVLWATYFFEVGPHGLPMPSFWRGLQELRNHASLGQVSYFNGRIGLGRWFWYFPEALLIKSTLGFLIGAAIALPLMMRRANRRGLIYLIPAGLFLVAAISSGLDMGVRHILPAIALSYPMIGVALRRYRRLLVGLAAISFAETAIVHPHYLSFFNLACGGPAAGERYLLDSNLDWGQEQARAAEWLAEHARGRDVSVHVFGNPRLMQWPHPTYRILAPFEYPRGLLVISKNIEHGFGWSYNIDGAGNEVREPPIKLQPGLKPVASIGTTLEIYELGR